MAMRDHPTHKGGVGFYRKQPGVDDTTGFFAIAKARPIPEQMFDPSGEVIRCDGLSTGPMGFHEWDATTGRCSCGDPERPDPTTGNHILFLRGLATIFVVIEALPYGFITYIELHDEAMEDEMIRRPHSASARTLQEVLRLLLEWDYAYTALGSREPIAEAARGMVGVLDIPAGVRSFLEGDMPDEKVARFVKGVKDARERPRPERIPDLPDEVDAWLEQKIIGSRPLGNYKD